MNPSESLPRALLSALLLGALGTTQAAQISDTNKYAWSENAGWINHRTTHGEVLVFPDHLEGFAWAENIGWVKLGFYSGGGAHTYGNSSASDWGVNNDGAGNLSGYAWSENAGWINFHPNHSQVTLATASGDFSGYAWGENIGWVHFQNAAPAYKVALVTGTDATTPSVTVNQASGQADPTGAGPIHFTAVFSEPIDTSSFTSADVTLGGTAGATSVNLNEAAPNDGTTFNLVVTGMTTSGTVTASLAAGRVTDLSGNPNSASTSVDNSVTYQHPGPTVASTSLQSTYTGTGPNRFSVRFSEAVRNLGSGDSDSVTNPANYLLVERSTNNQFDTLSCTGGRQPDDTQVTPTSVTYDSGTLTAQVNLAAPLPAGHYRLFVCGSTSIVDLLGNPINGGVDVTFDFVVQAAPNPIPLGGLGMLALLAGMLGAAGMKFTRVGGQATRRPGR